MLKGLNDDAVYYALILIFLGATLYLWLPGLLRTSGSSTPFISTPLNYSQVNLTILTSAKCKALCETDQVEVKLRELLVNLNVSHVEVNSTEGRKLAASNGVKLVPAYVFDESLTKSQAFPTFAQYVRNSGNGFTLSTFEVSSGYLYENEPSSDPGFELFVSSYDLNSIAFENKTFNVLKRFNNSINVSLHLVPPKAKGNEHAADSELVEDAIQLCALETGSPHVLDAVACRSRDIASCYAANSTALGFCAQFWQTCIDGWGLNSTEIQHCVLTRKETLLSREATYAANGSISGVPTTLLGNQYKLVGQRDETAILSLICAVYPSLDGCTIRAG